MKVFKLPLITLGVILLGYVQTAERGSSNNGDRGDVSKRVLLKGDDYFIQRLDTLTKEVEALKAQTVKIPSTPVVFLAKLTQQVTGSGHHIYFDQVDLNMGNAYNSHHGTFVAPVNGIYQFTLKACSDTNHFIVLDIIANSKLIERMIAGDTVYYACSSTTANVHLTSGDDVFVKQGGEGDMVATLQKFGLPVFTGILLQAD